MKNITVATKENVGYYNIMVESCKRNNIELIILGLGQKWEGLHMKFKLWLNYLNTLPDNEIIMVNDAYDIIILEDSKTILTKFKKFNKPIVFSYQDGFLINSVFNKCLEKVICSGNFIGYVKNIKEVIKIILKNENKWPKHNKGDQNILNTICQISPYIKNNIALDLNQDIFFVTSGDDFFYYKYYINGFIKNLKMKNNQLLNKNNKPISVLHLAANLNGNIYLQYLNYDISTVNSTGDYRIQQMFQFIKHFLNKYKNIILIIIVFFLII